MGGFKLLTPKIGLESRICGKLRWPVTSRSREGTGEWIVAGADVSEQVEARQQLQERARYLAFRSTLKSVVNYETDVLARCCSCFVSQLGLTGSAIWQLDRGVLRLAAQAGKVPDLVELPLEGNEIGRLLHQPRGELYNALSRSLQLPIADWVSENAVVSLAGHPVTLDGSTVAVLVGFSDHVLPVNLLEELREGADVLATWMRQKAIDERQEAMLALERRSRIEAETLLRLAESIAGEQSVKGLVQSVTDVGTELTSAAFGAFFYNAVGAQGEALTLYTISGVPIERFDSFPMLRATAVFAPTFDGEGTVLSQDITLDPRYGKNPPYNGLPSGHLPVRSYLAISVKHDGKVIGGLFFGHPEPGQFTEHHARLGEIIASYASLAFHRNPLA
jgi:hypothetical protein